MNISRPAWQRGESVNKGNFSCILDSLESTRPNSLRLNGQLKERLRHFVDSVEGAEHPIDDILWMEIDRCRSMITGRKSAKLKPDPNVPYAKRWWRNRNRRERIVSRATAPAMEYARPDERAAAGFEEEVQPTDGTVQTPWWVVLGGEFNRLREGIRAVKTPEMRAEVEELAGDLRTRNALARVDGNPIPLMDRASDWMVINAMRHPVTALVTYVTVMTGFAMGTTYIAIKAISFDWPHFPSAEEIQQELQELE